MFIFSALFTAILEAPFFKLSSRFRLYFEKSICLSICRDIMQIGSTILHPDFSICRWFPGAFSLLFSSIFSFRFNLYQVILLCSSYLLVYGNRFNSEFSTITRNMIFLVSTRYSMGILIHAVSLQYMSANDDHFHKPTIPSDSCMA